MPTGSSRLCVRWLAVLMVVALLPLGPAVAPPVAAQDGEPDGAAAKKAAAEAKAMAALVWSEAWARDDLETHARDLTAALLDDPDGPLAMCLFNALEQCAGDLKDPEAAFDPIDAIDLDSLTNQWNARSIRLRRIERLRTQGKREAALAEYRKLPLVREAATLGPLEIAGRAALTLPLPPDALPDPLHGAAAYHSNVTGRTIEWQRDQLDERRFDRFFGGRGDWRAQQAGAGFYLATQLVVSGFMPRPVQLRIYGSMAFSVSINGEPIGTFDHRRELLPANLMLRVTLTPGRHVLVIKHLRAEMQSIEVTDADGNWPAGVTVDMDSTVNLGAVQADADGADLITWGWQHKCLELARLAPDCPEALMLAAGAQRGRNLVDAAWSLTKRAHEVAETPRTCWALAEVQAAHGELPEAIRTRESVALYSKAVELDPQFAPALYALADDQLTNDRPDEARKLYDAIREFAPDSLHAQFARRSIFRAKRLDHLDHQLMEQLRETAPDHPQVRGYFANWYESLPDPRRARELALKDLAENPGSSGAALRVLRLSERIGDDPDGVAMEWERVLREFYEDDHVLQAAAEYFHRNQQYEREIEMCEQLLDRQPEAAAGLHEQMGRAAFLNGDPARGEAEYMAVLETASDRHDLRRYLAKRSGRDLYEFADQYKPDFDRLIETAPGPEDWPRSPAVQLHASTILKVFDDRSYIGVVTLVRKILTREGVDMFGSIQAGGELIEARVVQPDGTTWEPTVSGWSLQMPRLEPGSVQILRYRLQASAPADGRLVLPRYYFGDERRQEPVLLTRYVLLLPMLINDEPVGYNYPSPVEGFEGFDRSLTFEAKNVKADDLHEAHEPDDEELIGWVEFRPLRDWTEAYAQLLNRGTPWNRVTDTLQRKADEIAASVPAPAEGECPIEPVVRAVYDAVNDIVKEDGWGESPTATLMTNRGDRQQLFLALLAALGIKAGPVQVSSPMQAALWNKVDFGEPKIHLFRQELIRVPRDGRPAIYLTMASRLLPFGTLPAVVNGGTALIAEPEGCGFDLVAAPGILDDARRTEVELTVNADGSADAKGRFVASGVDGAMLNDRFRTVPDFQKRQQATGLAASLVGAIDLSAHSFTDPDQPGVPGTPFVATFEGRVAAFAQVDRNGISFRGGPRPLDLASGLAPTATREHDIYLRVGPIALVDTVTYRLGEGLSVKSLPAPLVLHNESISFSRTVQHTHDKDTGRHLVRISRTLVIRPARLPKSAWPRWLAFCQRIDQAEQEAIRLGR